MAQLIDGNWEALMFKCLKLNLSIIAGSDPKGESFEVI